MTRPTSRRSNLRRLVVTGTFAAAVVVAFVAARQRAVRVASPPPPVEGPAFSKEIVRIFQQHCQECHRPGDIAPFSLLSYPEAREHATAIKLMTRSRKMPPWKPAEGCGDFAGKRGLSQQEIDLIARWVDSGAPEGNRADLPKPLDFSSGWTLGAPDIVLANPTYTPPAGEMYRCFTLPSGVTSDQYVAAIDVRPGDRKSVHHVIAFIDTTGESVRLDEAEPGPGYQCFGGPGFTSLNSSAATLGGWAPGYRALALPENVGMLLPAGSRVVLQIHYHAHGDAPAADRTEFGIYLHKLKPAKILRFLPLINFLFTIPPGDSNYEVKAIPIQTPWAAHLWTIAPHMHLLGKKMHVEATLPSGETKCLINIDDWDFNWQAMYRFREPIALPRGTRLSMTAHFDNSADNPRNPNNPPKPVSWGEATTDEMCLAFLGYTLDSEDLTR